MLKVSKFYCAVRAVHCLLVSRQPGPSFEAAREEEQVGSFIASSPAALRSSLLIDGECSHAASEGDHFGNSC